LQITESRVSQLRSEAVGMLRDAINAQYDDGAQVPPRRAGIAAALRTSSAWRDRLNDVRLP
jgi:hypothetical protein